jgi:hypothetical protein
MFSPTIYSSYSIIDDQTALKAIKSTSEISILKQMLPGSEKGGYYRPLLVLTQLLDNKLWKLNPKITHAENLLLHLANALWIYLLTFLYLRKKIKLSGSSNNYPLVAALLFGLHPITTESVCWYSGRTDLLAGFFLLPAACVAVMWLEKRQKLFLYLSLALIAMSILAKETGLGMLLVLPLFYGKFAGDETPTYSPPINWQLFLLFSLSAIMIESTFMTISFLSYPLALGYGLLLLVSYQKQQNLAGKVIVVKSAQVLGIVLLCVLGTIGLFSAIRVLTFKSNMSNIELTLQLLLHGTKYVSSLFPTVITFYLKKFILPLPNNFYIRTLGAEYYLLSTVLLFAFVEISFRRNRELVLFVTGIALLLPSLPLSLGTISWTPFAERYMYISTAFWVVAAVLYMERHPAKGMLRGKLLFVLIALFGCATFNRCIVWQKNETLIADTLSHSSNNKNLKSLLIKAREHDKSLLPDQ